MDDENPDSPSAKERIQAIMAKFYWDTDRPRRKAEFRAELPRLILWKHDVAEMLGVGLRTLERMISKGEIPVPDCRLRGRPAWRTATIQEWAANGCSAVRRPA